MEFSLVIIASLLTIVFTVIFTIYIAIFLGKKDKHIVIFVTEKSGIRSSIAKRRVQPHIENIKYKTKTFEFDINKPIIRRKTKFIYYVDIYRGQLEITTKDLPLSPSLFNAIMTQEVISQLVGALRKKPMFDNIIIIIFCAVAFLALGYILGNFLPFENGA